MKDSLENLINETKGQHLVKQYYLYSNEVQQMVQNLYNATYRIGLYDAQIIYILDEALEPFMKIKYANTLKRTKTPQISTEDLDNINTLFDLK